MEDDQEEVALLFRKSDEGFGLCLHDFGHGLGPSGDRHQALFEFARCFFCQFVEEGMLILEMQVEGAGGVSGFGRDGVRRDGIRAAVLRKERAAGVEQPASRLLRARASRRVLRRCAAACGCVEGCTRFTDTHVIYDINVSWPAQ